jgi:two-component system, NtrC family, response regulator AtoC
MGSPLLIERDSASTVGPVLRVLREAAPRPEQPELLGTSHALQRARELLARAAVTDATVLVTGESGTGKELVAQSLHHSSPRRTGPFVALNCGAIAPGLVESELFGHERGSFTGAVRQKRGVFERARHGTLFLDEVTEMPLDAQVKLLRALETGKIERVGGEETIDVNVRVIAATNRDPSTAVADGVFRADLLYRLDVFPIHLAPLRERGDDIEILALHFLGELNAEIGSRKSFSPDAIRRLRRHPWPGNVRELRNVVQRAFLMSGDFLDEEVLPREEIRNVEHTKPSITIPLGTSIATADRLLLLATLDHCGGDKRRVARTLGISLKTLYNRLHEYAADDDGVAHETTGDES